MRSAISSIALPSTPIYPTPILWKGPLQTGTCRCRPVLFLRLGSLASVDSQLLQQEKRRDLRRSRHRIATSANLLADVGAQLGVEIAGVGVDDAVILRDHQQVVARGHELVHLIAA